MSVAGVWKAIPGWTSSKVGEKEQVGREKIRASTAANDNNNNALPDVD